jgi:hypothetical protein
MRGLLVSVPIALRFIMYKRQSLMPEGNESSLFTRRVTFRNTRPAASLDQEI